MVSIGTHVQEVEAMSDLIMVGQSAQVLIGEITRLQAVLKAHRDMLNWYQDTALAMLDRIEALEYMVLRLYQDTVVPDTGYCHRCGCHGFHDETCAMAEVEELLGLKFDVEEDNDEWDDEGQA